MKPSLTISPTPGILRVSSVAPSISQQRDSVHKLTIKLIQKAEKKPPSRIKKIKLTDGVTLNVDLEPELSALAASRGTSQGGQPPRTKPATQNGSASPAFMDTPAAKANRDALDASNALELYGTGAVREDIQKLQELLDQ